MDITELGASLRQARVQAGLTQAQLAEKLGTTQSVVARWERNGVEPRFGTVLKIAEATGAWLEFQVERGVDPHDWSLVEASLRLTPRERLDRLTRAVRFIHRGREAMREANSA